MIVEQNTVIVVLGQAMTDPLKVAKIELLEQINQFTIMLFF